MGGDRSRVGVAVRGAAPPPSPGAGGGRGGQGGAGRRGYVRRRLPGTGLGARPGGAAMGATSSGPGSTPAPVRSPQVRAAASAPGIPLGISRPGILSLTLSPVPQGRTVGSWVRALLSRAGSVPVSVPVPVPGLALAPRGPAEEPPLPGWPLPQLVSLFLPEFPVRPSARQQQLKILGFVAKGSFGTILKVLDCGREKVCAVKVVPKVEVLRRDTLKQCKEEVSIQRQVRHPFVHGLGDSWQGQRHLFIMCTYCSTGDLHALWRAAGCLAEATVRLFAAELVLVLVYLHDLGIMHRDVKCLSPFRWRTSSWMREGTSSSRISASPGTCSGASEPTQSVAPCSTWVRGAVLGGLCWGAQTPRCSPSLPTAPEVLSGGPYSHAADWWSLGVLLFALASGEFPVAPAGDHVAMLERVKQSSYESPPEFSPELARLLAELLCHNPLYRLRYLHHFQGHPFFRGVAFDADLLQKDPVVVAVAPRPPEQPPPDPATFADFDYDLAAPPDRPWPG
ncbi:ribosomal protein S6 kinase-related protein isoform X1 [Vidua chalybeata]|uniref:ribosomal protein S6 kinase-related protein isoform X1 n=1 Tax=Vidua chalybeata TaxID=81927 RepID=UPI0023A7F54A|nr:ribosomal protein S6 kinase-related protein isoform X1 [Vidua chalybeata]